MCANHTIEAKKKGADVMVTPCPLCRLELDGMQPRAESHKKQKIQLPVLHRPQLVGLAIGFTPKDMKMERHIVSTKSFEKQIQWIEVLSKNPV